MPKSKEYVDSTDDSSDEEKEVKPAKEKKRESEEKEEKVSKKKREPEEKEQKVTKKAKRESDEDDNTWDLGNNRKVTVRDFKGKLLVDIREMYFDAAGNTKPGKKGISLTMPQWRKLISIIDDVDEAVKSKA